MTFNDGLGDFMYWLLSVEIFYTIILIYFGRKIFQINDDVLSLQITVQILREQNKVLTERLRKYETN